MNFRHFSSCVEKPLLESRVLFMNESDYSLSIIVDNKTLREDLRSDWGFSCLIRSDRYAVLFDTGSDGSILLDNMDRMDMDPGVIKSVVLSHGHGDHTGGLGGLLAENRGLDVYVPVSFPERFKEAVKDTGAGVKDVSGHMMIHPRLFTTGEIGEGIKEQSLVLQTSKGLVVMTGCAHPGIVRVVEQAVKAFGQEVNLLIGGFHLMGESQKEIWAITGRLDTLSVQRIAPCHCTGDTAMTVFQRHYKERDICCGAGLELKIPLA